MEGFVHGQLPASGPGASLPGTEMVTPHRPGGSLSESRFLG
jgi:hypothetical protein